MTVYLLTVKIDIDYFSSYSLRYRPATDNRQDVVQNGSKYEQRYLHVRRCLQLRLNHITGKILQRWAARKERNELFGTRFFCRHPGACPTIHEERSS